MNAESHRFVFQLSCRTLERERWFLCLLYAVIDSWEVLNGLGRHDPAHLFPCLPCRAPCLTVPVLCRGHGPPTWPSPFISVPTMSCRMPNCASAVPWAPKQWPSLAHLSAHAVPAWPGPFDTSRSSQGISSSSSPNGLYISCFMWLVFQ